MQALLLAPGQLGGLGSDQCEPVSLCVIWSCGWAATLSLSCSPCRRQEAKNTRQKQKTTKQPEQQRRDRKQEKETEDGVFVYLLHMAQKKKVSSRGADNFLFTGVLHENDISCRILGDTELRRNKRKDRDVKHE